jgi:hypothetical protein
VQVSTKLGDQRNPDGSTLREDLAAIEAAVPADAVVGDRYADMRSIGR